MRFIQYLMELDDQANQQEQPQQDGSVGGQPASAEKQQAPKRLHKTKEITPVVVPRPGDFVVVNRNNKKILTIISAIHNGKLMLKSTDKNNFDEISKDRVTGGKQHKKYTRGQILSFLGKNIDSNNKVFQNHVYVFDFDEGPLPRK